MTTTPTYNKTNKSKEEGKDQELIQSSATPNSGQKHKKKHPVQESQKDSTFPESDPNAAMERQNSMTDTKHK